jgi:hypothetical protein
MAIVSSLAGLVTLFSVVPAVADSMLCRSKVEEKIRSLNLEPADIHHMRSFERTVGNRTPVTHVETYIWFNCCEGCLVIHLQSRPFCRVNQIYSNPECGAPKDP